jgi:hypothetical protein
VPLRCRLACNILRLKNLSGDYSRSRASLTSHKAIRKADFALRVNSLGLPENSRTDGDKPVSQYRCSRRARMPLLNFSLPKVLMFAAGTIKKL